MKIIMLLPTASNLQCIILKMCLGECDRGIVFVLCHSVCEGDIKPRATDERIQPHKRKKWKIYL